MLSTVFVDPEKLYDELYPLYDEQEVKRWGLSETLNREEKVLKKFSLDNPVDEANWDPSDLRLLRLEVLAFGRLDETGQYGRIRDTEFEPVTSKDVFVTCWTQEIWAALFAAREQVPLKEMMHHEIEWFRAKGY